MTTSITLTVLPDTFAIARLDAGSALPQWVTHNAGFFSITRTSDELSVICIESHLPSTVKAERGWRILKLEGPFDFNQVGILKQVLDPLAEARIVIMAISTHDTDYVMVKAAQVEQAVTALTRYGHIVNTRSTDDTEKVVVNCSWRLPDGRRTTASFAAEVMAYEPPQDRWIMRLTDVRTEPALNDDVRNLIQAQVGKWVYVPSEARQGMALPLKYETLTGQVKFFRNEDPRTQSSTSRSTSS
jgi:hypothetical protein